MTARKISLPAPSWTSPSEPWTCPRRVHESTSKSASLSKESSTWGTEEAEEDEEDEGLMFARLNDSVWVSPARIKAVSG